MRTPSFRSFAAVDTVHTDNATLGGTQYQFSLQLNAFLAFASGGTQYVYWTQDVAEIDSLSRDVSFLDNVWNASSEALTGTALHGNGSVTGSGTSSYYGYAPACGPSTCFVLPTPGQIELALNASVTGSVPTVRFEIGSGGSFVTFDTIEFPWASTVADLTGFVVNSTLWNGGSCPRCYGDVEWVVGGPGDGYDTSFDGGSNLTLSLEYWTGTNYAAVPAAVDYGIATAEGVGHVTDVIESGAGGVPTANLSWGGGALHTLWNAGSVAVVSVSDHTATTAGSYAVNGSSASFEGAGFLLTLLPGPQTLTVACNGSDFSWTLDLAGGEFLTLEFGAPPLVFVPSGLPPGTVWTVTIGSEQVSGTGNLTFGESPGSYDYAVGAVAGYTSTPAGGNVTVVSSGANVTISFRAVPSTLDGFEATLWHYLPLLLVGLVVVAIAGVLSAVARRRRQATSYARPIRPAPVALTAFCGHCGASLAPGAMVCSRCGTRRSPGP